MESMGEVLDSASDDLRRLEESLPLGDQRVKLHQTIITLEALSVRVREELGE